MLVKGLWTVGRTADFDLMPPTRTIRVKLWQWEKGLGCDVVGVEEKQWPHFDAHKKGRWISEPQDFVVEDEG